MLSEPRVMTPEIKALCSDAAKSFGVTPAVHSQDQIFWFLMEHPRFTVDKAVAYYFSTGAESADKLRSLVEQRLNKPKPTVLEFASGYGCVTRHLASRFPHAVVTACDIHDEAVAFTPNEIGTECLGSTSVPERFDLQLNFDVVFALSFFSHMPASTFGRWLSALARHVAAGGLMIFTTHGQSNVDAMNVAMDETGYWFIRQSDQKDLDLDDYGTTIALFDYVHRQLKNLPGMRLVEFREAFWWGRQDVYVVQRTK